MVANPTCDRELNLLIFTSFIGHQGIRGIFGCVFVSEFLFL